MMNCEYCVAFLLRFLLSLIFVIPSFFTKVHDACAQQQQVDEGMAPFALPPKIKRLISDSFSNDTINQYQIPTDDKSLVKWSTGKIKMLSGAKLQRTLNAGSWLSIEIDINFPTVNLTDETSESKLWLDFAKSPDICLALKQTNEDGNVNAEIALFQAEDSWKVSQSEKQITQTIELNGPLQHGTWVLEYRYGLIKITLPDKSTKKFVCLSKPGLLDSVILTNERTSPQDSPVSLRSFKVNAADRIVLDFNAQNRKEVAQLNERIKQAKTKNRDGRNKDAILLMDGALQQKTRQLGSYHPDILNDLIFKAHLQKSVGYFDACLDTISIAKAKHRELFGGDHIAFGELLIEEADLYQVTGDYANAKRVLIGAKAIHDEILNKDFEHYVVVLTELASIYRTLGDYHLSKPLFQESLRIHEKMLEEKHPGYVKTLNEFARLYKSIGAPDKAIPLVQSAKSCLELNGSASEPQYATTLSNLAIIEELMGHYEKSMLHVEEAKALINKLYGVEHTEYARCLFDRAGLLFRAKRYAQAEQDLNSAILIFRKEYGIQHPIFASALVSLAHLKKTKGEYEKARKLLRQAIAIQKEVLGVNHIEYAKTIANLGLLDVLEGNTDRGTGLLAKSLISIRKHLDVAAAVQSSKHQRKYVLQYRNLLDIYISFISNQEDDLANCCEQLLNWKGITLLRRSQYRRLAADPVHRRNFERLSSQSGKHFGLISEIPDSFEKDDWLKRLQELETSKDAIEKEIALRGSVFAEIAEPFQIVHLQQALPSDRVFVNFFHYNKYTINEKEKGEFNIEPHYCAVIIQKYSKPELIELGKADQIDEQVGKWRASFGQTASSIQAGKELRQLVWLPIENQIGDQKKILISPDGALSMLPFCALPGKKPNSYLIETFEFTTIPVPQLIQKMVLGDFNPKGNSKLLLLFGGIDFGNADFEVESEAESDIGELLSFHPSMGNRSGSGAGWQTLEQTIFEVNDIEKVLIAKYGTGAKEFILKKSGVDATEESFRANAAQFQYIHLATHGFFAPEQFKLIRESSVSSEAGINLMFSRMQFSSQQVDYLPPGLLSGLVFAGANVNDHLNSTDEDNGSAPDQNVFLRVAKEDGYITAEEIAYLSLPSTRLVTLSACETGLGEVAGGEGMLGLQRAFQIAGAQSVLSSLRKVDDTASSKLMVRFYKNLWEKKMTRAGALREAQIWALKNPTKLRGLDPINDADDNARTSPGYWAPWVLSGDWRAVTKSDN